MPLSRFVALALLGPLSVYAQAYGDWTVDKLDKENVVVAMSLNENGNVLGKACAANGCSWVVVLNTTTCEPGSSYPALMSASTGAGHLSLICTPNDRNKTRYIVKEYESMEIAMRAGEMVGIAMPLETGQFRVTRFPIKGWDAAKQRLATRTSEMLKRSDQTL